MLGKTQNRRNGRYPRLIGGVLGGEQYDTVTVPRDDDIVLLTEGGALPDAEAALRVYIDDPADDIAWFTNHPEAETRVRPITADEAKALGYSTHATVTVEMTPLGPNRHFRDHSMATK